MMVSNSPNALGTGMDKCNEAEGQAVTHPDGATTRNASDAAATTKEPPIAPIKAVETELIEVTPPATGSGTAEAAKAVSLAVQALTQAGAPTMPEIERSEIPELKADAPRAEPAQAPLARIGLPRVGIPKLDWIKSLMTDERPSSREPLAGSEANASARDPQRRRRLAVFAASLMAAAALGALGGAVAASTLASPAAPPAPTVPSFTAEDAQALKALVSQLRADVSALKVNIETSNKAATGQFAKIAERLDRIERAQSEPTARIGKAVDALERLERRADTGTSKEATAAIASAPAAPPAPPAAVSAPTPPPVPGWSVREVYRGVALIQSPRFGLIEVEAGDVIPGIGKVESIRKQDGRWVVTTSRGIIASR
jgi:hypothetical protein